MEHDLKNIATDAWSLAAEMAIAFKGPAEDERRIAAAFVALDQRCRAAGLLKREVRFPGAES